MEKRVTKAELIDAVSITLHKSKHSSNKETARELVNVVFDYITDALNNGYTVTISTFGRFKVTQRRHVTFQGKVINYEFVSFHKSKKMKKASKPSEQ